MSLEKQSLDPVRQQCALLKERLDRATGHEKSSVKPRGRTIVVSIYESDIRLLRGRIPDRIGIIPVDIEIRTK